MGRGALHVQKPKQRPETRKDVLAAGDARLVRAAEDESGDLRRAQLRPVQSRALVENEPSRELGARTDGGRGKTTLPSKVGCVLAHEPADRRIVDHRQRRGDDADATQVAQQRLDGSSREVMRMSPTAVPQECCDDLVAHIGESESLRVEPPAKMGCQLQQISGRQRRIALCQQVGPEPLRVRLRGPRTLTEAGSNMPASSTAKCREEASMPGSKSSGLCRVASADHPRQRAICACRRHKLRFGIMDLMPRAA